MGSEPYRPVLLGVLAGLAVVLQLGPVYWPGPGYLLAMAATLPVALGTLLAPRRSVWFLLAAALLIGLTALEEMFVFLLLTAPLGLALGLTASRPAWQTILLAAGLLTGGMLLMPHLAGVLPWGGVESGWAALQRLGAYAAFALFYAGLWQRLFAKICSRVLPAVRYTKGS